jgi:hypothetical protein
MAFRKNDLVRITDLRLGWTHQGTVEAEQNGHLTVWIAGRCETIPLVAGWFSVEVVLPTCSPVAPVVPLRNLDDVLLELFTRDCPRNSGEAIARELDGMSRRSA